jgi:PKD repeat protein
VVRHVFKTPGSYLVTLAVHAGPQLQSQGSSTVVVQGKATTAVLLPQPGAGATSAPVQQGAPTTVDLTGSFPAAGKDLVSATVDFGDCTPIATLTGAVTGWSSLHSYATLGLHTVTVAVTDSSGTVSKASTVLDVVAPVVAVPPVVAASASASAPAAAPTSIGDWSSTPGPTPVAPVAPVAPTGDAQPAWS